MTYGLTRKQARCMAFIKKEIGRGNSPSFEEIRVGLKYKSKATVHRLVHGLVERGHLFVAGDRIKRSLTLTEPLGACPHCGLKPNRTLVLSDILGVISRLRARLSPELRHLSNDSVGTPTKHPATELVALPGRGNSAQRSGSP